MNIQNATYPLNFKFKILTLSSDFGITDAQGKYLAYVRQKMFKLKEDVIVFSDESKMTELYQIKADRWLDFNASYEIKDLQNQSVLGRLARKGMRSIWKATYHIADHDNQPLYTISEDNAWVKVLDGFASEIPLVGMLTGYFFNPSYSVKDASGRVLFQLKKKPSFFGRHFELSKISDTQDESLIILSVMMMLMLENNRG